MIANYPPDPLNALEDLLQKRRVLLVQRLSHQHVLEEAASAAESIGKIDAQLDSLGDDIQRVCAAVREQLSQVKGQSEA